MSTSVDLGIANRYLVCRGTRRVVTVRRTKWTDGGRVLRLRSVPCHALDFSEKLCTGFVRVRQLENDPPISVLIGP